MKYNAGENTANNNSLVNAFNAYFSTVYQANSGQVNINYDMPSKQMQADIQATNCEWKNDNTSLTTKDSILEAVNYSEVWHAVKKMKLTNSMGYDGVPIIVFKKGPFIMIDYLVILFNKILQLQ